MLTRRQLIQQMMALGLVAAIPIVPEPVQKYFFLDQTYLEPATQKIEIAVHYPDRPVTWVSDLADWAPLPNHEDLSEIASRVPLAYADSPHDAFTPKTWPPQPTIIRRGDPNWSFDAELYDALRYDVPR